MSDIKYFKPEDFAGDLERLFKGPTLILPAGSYYVGDPCYVISDDAWDEACDRFDHNEMSVNAMAIMLSNGQALFPMNTMYGDGEYMDQFGNSYPVDAGMIGLVPLIEGTVEASGKDEFKVLVEGRETPFKPGVIHTFDRDFEVTIEDGLMMIGNIRINTEDEDEDEDEDNVFSWN